MPSIPLKQQTTAKKNNVYYGIILILTVMFAILRSPLPAQASPGDRDRNSQPNTQPDLFKRPLRGEFQPAFGTKGQKHWYVQGAVATTLDREEAFPQRFGLAGAGLSKFIFEAHSINLELNTIYFSQPSDDARWFKSGSFNALAFHS